MCASSRDCCADQGLVCDPTDSNCCRPTGTSCLNDYECCGNATCNGLTCCTENGKACNGNGDCCSNNCVDGFCACSVAGGACASYWDCCNEIGAGSCQREPNVCCRLTNSPCTDDFQCCSGTCAAKGECT